MKKIFIWSKKPPFKRFSEKQIIVEDLLERNVGNLLFRTAAARTLMMDTQQAFYTKRDVPPDLNDAWIERINSECAFMALPLANAFRAAYMGQLEFITRLIEKLKIPCVVMGVGIQCDSIDSLHSGFSFDDTVRHFIKAVLDHSAKLGLRGEFTAQYLEHLGFIRDRHFQVIGCPSMFNFGAELPQIRLGEIGPSSHVCINTKPAASTNIHAFMQRSCAALPSYSYIPQTTQELCMLNLGALLLGKKSWKEYNYFPTSRSSSLLHDGRVTELFDANVWIDYMRNFEFSYGCNIHGNIAALLAGVPAVVIGRDLRVMEIANYFEIPCVAPDALEGKQILDLLDGLDFSGINRGHTQRFERYVGFLKDNGIENIYALPETPSPTPFDRRMAECGAQQPLQPPKRLDFERRMLGFRITQRALCAAIHRRLKHER